MASIEVRINAPAIRRLLRDPTGQVSRDIRRRAARVAADQRINVPVRTGHLRSSISVSTHQTSSGLAADVGPHTEYSLYVELGTHKHGRAQRFIRRSLRAAR